MNVSRTLYTFAIDGLVDTFMYMYLIVFDSRYYAAISAPEAWQIIDESDYDATDARSAVRPTNSALTVAELAERLSGE